MQALTNQLIMSKSVIALKQTIETDNEAAFKALLTYCKFTEDQLINVMESFQLTKITAKYIEAIFDKPGAIDLSFKSDGPLINTIIIAIRSCHVKLAIKLLDKGIGEIAPSSVHAIIEAAARMNSPKIVKHCLAKFPINGSIVHTLLYGNNVMEWAEEAIKACPDINIDENGQKLKSPCILRAVAFAQRDLIELLVPLSTPEDIEEARKMAERDGKWPIYDELIRLGYKFGKFDAPAPVPPKKCLLKPDEIDAILKFACEKRLMTLIDDYSHLDMNLALDNAIENRWIGAIDKLSKAGAVWKFQGKSYKIVDAESN